MSIISFIVFSTTAFTTSEGSWRPGIRVTQSARSSLRRARLMKPLCYLDSKKRKVIAIWVEVLSLMKFEKATRNSQKLMTLSLLVSKSAKSLFENAQSLSLSAWRNSK